MPVVFYVAPYIEFLFAVIGWGLIIAFCWKKGWILGNNNMSRLSGMIYSLGTGALCGIVLMGILIGHFDSL